MAKKILKIKNLKDNKSFRLSERKGAVIYTLLRLDRKLKKAVFESPRKFTYSVNWDTPCYI